MRMLLIYLLIKLFVSYHNNFYLLFQDVKNEKEASETLLKQLQLYNLKVDRSVSTMVIPGTSADVSKLSSNHYKKISSSDTYPSSITSENIFSKTTTNNNNNNNGGRMKKNFPSSNKQHVNDIGEQQVIRQASSKRFSKSKTLQWACSNDFPYMPSEQSLPRSTADCMLDNRELHVLYCRNNCKHSGHSSFYESNMKMTNEQRELQKHMENDF